MEPTAETHLSRLGEKTALELLSETGFDWGPLDRNVCAAALFKRRVGDAPAVIGLLGGASSGKSTLFNSLLGSEVSRISAHAHETRGPVAAIHQQRRAEFESWKKQDWVFPGLEASLLPFGRSTIGSAGAVCLYPHELAELSGVVIVDMPDVTSKMSADEGFVTRTLLPWFDALIIVADEERWFDATVFEETVEFARNLGPKTWVVFNQTENGEALTSEDRQKLANHAGSLRASGFFFSRYEPGSGYRPVSEEAQIRLRSWLRGLDDQRRGTALEEHLQRRCAAMVRTNVTRSEQFSQLRHAIDRELEHLTTEASLTTDLLTDTERKLLGLGHRFLPLYDVVQAARRRINQLRGRGKAEESIDFDKRTDALAEVLRRNLEHRFHHATDRVNQLIVDSPYVAESGQSWAGDWSVPQFDEMEWAVRIRAHLDAWRQETGKHARRADVAALSVGVPLLVADLLFLGGAGFTLTWAAAWVGGLFGTKGLASLVQRSPAFKEYQTTVRAYQSFVREALTEQCDRNLAAIPRRHLRSTNPVYESVLHWSTPGRR